jgi:hypothetical protein
MSDAHGPAFTPADLDRALQALDLIFQEQQWPQGEARFRQLRLVGLLREQGISRALALAVIEDLLARGVFRAGESFLDLKITVRFDGHQTDQVTPDRYLHPLPERWYGYLAERRKETVTMPSTSAPNDQPPARPPDSPSALERERDRLVSLHRQAVRCLNAVLALHAFQFTGDGEARGQKALHELRDALAQAPPSPSANDPFCRDNLVEVAGLQATSAHAAAFAIARRTWSDVELESLNPRSATDHADGDGTPYTRVMFDVIRQAPTEVAWSAEVWHRVCAGLERNPSPDQDWFEGALALEWNLAFRRLEARFGHGSPAGQTPHQQSAIGTDPVHQPTKDGLAEAPTAKKKRTSKIARDKKLEARDRWLYKQCCNGVPYKDVKSQLKEKCRQKGWAVLDSVQGIRNAANTFAKRHKLPAPPRRQVG